MTKRNLSQLCTAIATLLLTTVLVACSSSDDLAADTATYIYFSQQGISQAEAQ